MRGKTKGLNLKFYVALAAVAAAWTIALGGASALGGDETYKGLRMFSDVIEIIEKTYVDPVESDKLVQGAIQGMLQSLDPHSAFMLPEAYNDLQIETKGEFGGIGIVLSMKDKFLTVVAAIEGTPAFKAGIQPRDRIIEVDGKPAKDMNINDAVKIMRGPKGTKVTLSILREGAEKVKEFTMVRDIIPLDSVRHTVIRPGYGYLRVTNFRDNTLNEVLAALKSMESSEKPLKGVILDLRDNPGGLLNMAVDVADLFLEDGDIVSIKGRQKQHTKIYRAHPDKTPRKYALAVLINDGSASASEIVAGALQDHHRAVVLGTTSFGKGSVQTVEPLRDGYGLKLTIARYYTPGGRSIQAEGIVPDIEVRRIKPGETEGEEAAPFKRYKEKDLENHLDSETEGKNKKSGKKDDATKEEDNGGAENEETDEDAEEAAAQYLTPKPERLLKDNQVTRALDILVGYTIMTGK
jgi:carboxyl-terminal processing protease